MTKQVILVPRSRRRTHAVAFICISTLLAVTACGCKGDTPSQPTSADTPSANPPAALGGGAMGAPEPPEATSWTPQDAADHLVNYGLTFDSGLQHNPSYVECNATDVADAFDCYVEVEDVPLYWISLTVAGESSARFEFLYYD